MDINRDFYIFKEKFGGKRDNTYLCTEFRTSIRACGKKKKSKIDMKKNNQNIFVVVLMSCVMLLAMVQVAIAQPQRTDSLTQSKALTSEPDEMRGRMMTSPLPVTLRQQGRQICVQSRYNQLLPIYTEGGTFYTAFRLSKGTNWITGLPKGTYLINNRKFTIY